MNKLLCVLMIVAMLIFGMAYAHEEIREYVLLKFSGDGMSDAISDGEIIICSTSKDVVQRNDVVVYALGAKTMINRIVAVPGDKVYRENGVTHVVYDNNGSLIDEALDERYALFSTGSNFDDYTLYTLNENEYFVVGDNRYNSYDSRNWKDANPENDIGPIHKESIIYVVIGKAR